MGTLVDEHGKTRKLWALVVTLSASRYPFAAESTHRSSLTRQA